MPDPTHPHTFPWRHLDLTIAAAHTSYPFAEWSSFLCCALALAHACAQPAAGGGRSRHLVLFAASFVGGIGGDVIFTWLPLADNFFHAQASVMLYSRLPLYIVTYYVGWLYWPMVVCWQFKLPRLAEAGLCALLCLAFYWPWDVVGVKMLWWTWHDSDSAFANRLLNVPLASTEFVLLQCFSWALLLRLGLDRVQRTRQQRRQRPTTFTASASTMSTFVYPLTYCCLTVPGLMTLMPLAQVATTLQIPPPPCGRVTVGATALLFGALALAGAVRRDEESLSTSKSTIRSDRGKGEDPGEEDNLRSGRGGGRGGGRHMWLVGAALLVHFGMLAGVALRFDSASQFSTGLHQTFHDGAEACARREVDFAGGRFRFLCEARHMELPSKDFRFDCSPSSAFASATAGAGSGRPGEGPVLKGAIRASSEGGEDLPSTAGTSVATDATAMATDGKSNTATGGPPRSQWYTLCGTEKTGAWMAASIGLTLGCFVAFIAALVCAVSHRRSHAMWWGTGESRAEKQWAVAAAVGVILCGGAFVGLNAFLPTSLLAPLFGSLEFTVVLAVAFEVATLSAQTRLRLAYPMWAPAAKGGLFAAVVAVISVAWPAGQENQHQDPRQSSSSSSSSSFSSPVSASSTSSSAPPTYPLLLPAPLPLVVVAAVALTVRLLTTTAQRHRRRAPSVQPPAAAVAADQARYFVMCVVEEVAARYVLLNLIGRLELRFVALLPISDTLAGVHGLRRCVDIAAGAVLFGAGHLYHGRDDDGGWLAVSATVLSVPLGVLATTPGFGMAAAVAFHFAAGMLVKSVDVQKVEVCAMVVGVLVVSVVPDNVVAVMGGGGGGGVLLHSLVAACCVLSLVVVWLRR
jgi:hypothetical protein